VRAEPNNPNVLDTYGYLLLKNGRVADARKILERVSSILPNNPSVNYHLALAYREAGDRAQAISRVNKALEAGRFMEEAQARQLLAELTGTRKAR
jgi:predicted Zn-dependent protease